MLVRTGFVQWWGWQPHRSDVRRPREERLAGAQTCCGIAQVYLFHSLHSCSWLSNLDVYPRLPHAWFYQEAHQTRVNQACSRLPILPKKKCLQRSQFSVHISLLCIQKGTDICIRHYIPDLYSKSHWFHLILEWKCKVVSFCSRENGESIE